MKKLIAIALTVLGIIVGALFLSPGAHAGETTSKQVICHATASDKNPYVKQVVAKESIVKGGHGNSGINAGDIIPPFDYNFGGNDSGTYPGQNWTDETKALWANDCSAVNNILTPVLPTPPQATCVGVPNLVIPPQPEGVTVSSAYSDKGTYEILYGLPNNTSSKTYSFPEGFKNPVTITPIPAGPGDPLWDDAKGACNLPDTGAGGGIKGETILQAGGLIGAGLVVTALAKRRRA